MPDDQLIAAFRATHYEVHAAVPFVLRVDAPSPRLDEILTVHAADCAAFVTAWNPFSGRQSETVNQAAQAHLEEELRRRGYTLIAGIGVDPCGQWPGEPSVLVLGMARPEAVEIGRACRQHAVVWARRGAPVELVLIDGHST